jgi:tetratricopeptide (TPR) repeat protein
MGICYQAAAQNEKTSETAQRMRTHDPLSAFSWMLTAAACWFVGRPADAIPHVRKGLELDPQNFILHWCAGYTHAIVGSLAEAAGHAQILNRAGPDVPYTRQLLALVDGLEGRPAAALERLVSIDVAPLDAHHKFHLAEAFALAGDSDRALTLLEQALPGFYPHLYYSEYCRFLDPLRGTSRFQAILRGARELAEVFPARLEALRRAPAL